MLVMRFSERSRDALFVFVLALLVRMAFVAWARGRFPPTEDAEYYDVLAHRLASGAGYTWRWPDGVVTYAAHYPVGYPAILAAAYRVFGATLATAMAVNAVLGAAGAWAAHRLVDFEGIARWRPLAAALAVALHPALVPYTGALMTEGVTASLLILAAAIASRAREAVVQWPSVIGAGVVVGVATLVRPQSLLLAPMLGALAARPGAGKGVRLSRAAAATAIALMCVTPWSARNCIRMHRCALVSVNGGWNLLIGAQTSTGGWEPVSVPPECATEWGEAAKDACFERAALQAIKTRPAEWLANVPAKLAATFDYFGAGPWYLHASNAAIFGERSKALLGAVETVVCRVLLVAALIACARMAGPRWIARRIVASAGVVSAITTHAWLAYMAIGTCVALLGGRAATRAPPSALVAAAVIAATAVVHAAVFGAGRYGLVVVPFVTAMAFARSDKNRHKRTVVAPPASTRHSPPVDAAWVIANGPRVS